MVFNGVPSISNCHLPNEVPFFVLPDTALWFWIIPCHHQDIHLGHHWLGLLIRVNKHLSKSPGKHRAVTKELVCKVKLTFPSATKTDSVRWGNIEQLCRIEHSYLPISNFLLQLQTFWVRKTEFFKVNSWFSKRTIDWPIKCQCCSHIETSQLICTANEGNTGT